MGYTGIILLSVVREKAHCFIKLLRLRNQILAALLDMRRISGILCWNVSVSVALVFGTFSVQNWSSDKDVKTIVCEYRRLELPNSDVAVICEYIGEPCSAAVHFSTLSAPTQKDVNCTCWRRMFPGLHQAYCSILGKCVLYLIFS